MKTKTVILATDISGLGKVAATAALPLFSICQLEVALLPTMILSSHTGGFPDVYIDDYTHGMLAFLKQWQSLEFDFSALVTGYLKSDIQVENLLRFKEEKSLPLIVDPIMGDKGTFYQGFSDAHLCHMRRLCQHADLVLPNLTEACLLLEEPYRASLSEDRWEDYCKRLAELGPSKVLLTGLPMKENQIGVAYFDEATEEFNLFSSPFLPQHFFGTGDILTTLVAAAFIQEVDIKKALPVILKFIEKSLALSFKEQIDPKKGVFYQPYLGELFADFQALMEEKDEETNT